MILIVTIQHLHLYILVKAIIDILASLHIKLEVWVGNGEKKADAVVLKLG